MYKAKYKATNNDASVAFYKAHAQKIKSKHRIEKCEIEKTTGEKMIIDNPAEIAGHFAKTYNKLFNTVHVSSKEMLAEFMGDNIKMLAKIKDNERIKMSADISF